MARVSMLRLLAAALLGLALGSVAPAMAQLVSYGARDGYLPPGLIITTGYAIASLPAGVTGARAHVTNQLTTCAAIGAALTAGGSKICPVFYDGTAWVGG